MNLSLLCCRTACAAIGRVGAEPFRKLPMPLTGFSGGSTRQVTATNQEHMVALTTDEIRGYPDKKTQQELICQDLAVLFSDG